ncbi:maltose/moltooligosaccharide transporter [Candidatus Gastranaerophilus sp. (ex Termes propinquus)]|nr:maltose/moltooligosaccharide transporter [Candidatus Gastranaerophilus sp. (ex Termes propinquus)]
MASENLQKFSTAQLLNFCLGFFGLQFAWQMRIILSGPVTSGLGADPFIFGLIWLAGPVTGIIVQPIIGALSDKTCTRFGRRLPYIFGGAVLSALALALFPYSGKIAALFGDAAPVWLGLLIAALLVWVLDACVNAAQGPYRALVPDNIPKEQHAEANSYLSFAIGLGSVVAAGTAPFLKYVFNIQMSIEAQFLMAAIAFLGAATWTCLTIKERKLAKAEESTESCEIPKEERKSFLTTVKEFFALSPEVGKICTIQFFSWIGIMCMFINFTNYVIHTLYKVPNLTLLDEAQRLTYTGAMSDGGLFASMCFAIFNLVCFIVAIPIGKLAGKFGNKYIHFVAMSSMAVAYLIIALIPNVWAVGGAMALAGIGWASVLALPFAMFSKYIKPGTEGSIMGVFNIFIAAPQILVCTLVAWFIKEATYMANNFTYNHWEYAFYIGAAMLIGAAISTLTIKEGKEGQ